MKLYVGNLAWATTNESMKAAFAQFGQVDSATVMMDKMTGRSRGFGFVEMPNDAEANTAIERMNGSNLDGRDIVVNEARPREEGAGSMGGGAPRRSFGGGDRGPRSGGFGGGQGGMRRF
jgi:RNA recognition motif-containing protein